METVVYLDTNILLILAMSEDIDRISVEAYDHIRFSDRLLISPIVLLELKYLNEIKRINKSPKVIFQHLEKKIKLSVCRKPFEDVALSALIEDWSRDPFDRIIVAQAAIEKNLLITIDKKIKRHYRNCLS